MPFGISHQVVDAITLRRSELAVSEETGSVAIDEVDAVLLAFLNGVLQSEPETLISGNLLTFQPPLQPGDHLVTLGGQYISTTTSS